MTWKLYIAGGMRRSFTFFRKVRHISILLSIFLIMSFPIARAEWAHQSCAFPHRIPITLTAGASGHSTETRIDLVSADFPASYTFTVDGDDIRVFEGDDLTPVSFVVAEWDAPTRAAQIYVRTSPMAAGSTRTLYIYFGDGTILSGSSATVVFPDIGMRLRSRVSTADPVSPSDAITQFTAATVDVYNAVRSSVSGINNRAVGGTNGNYGWCVSAVLNVTPATTGSWGFRYGADFGRGGHLFVKGQQLEEDWNDNLWWANNYANTAETLEGAITLSEGWHRYEALGFEDCCDGPTGFQARPPGGAWQDLSSSNFPLRAVECITPTVTVTKAPPQSCSTTLEAVKSVDVVSDVIGTATLPYAMPGSLIGYDITVTNPGQTVDASTLVLGDVLPPDIALIVSPASIFSFTDGSPSSGLSFTYAGPASTTDSVEFSTDGIDFSYVPTGPIDGAITHVRFKPSGTFAPNNAGAKPSFTVRLLGSVK